MSAMVKMLSLKIILLLFCLIFQECELNDNPIVYLNMHMPHQNLISHLLSLKIKAGLS